MVFGFIAAVTTNVVGNHIYDNMATPTPYAKDLGNLLYHSAVVGGLSVGYSMILKKALKMKPADLSKIDLEDGVKVVGTVALAKSSFAVGPKGRFEHSTRLSLYRRTRTTPFEHTHHTVGYSTRL